jgi:hypothetical protein
VQDYIWNSWCCSSKISKSLQGIVEVFNCVSNDHVIYSIWYNIAGLAHKGNKKWEKFDLKKLLLKMYPFRANAHFYHCYWTRASYRSYCIYSTGCKCRQFIILTLIRLHRLEIIYFFIVFRIQLSINIIL